MQIREVTAQGIHYVDERGRKQYLDFAISLEEHISQIDYPAGTRPHAVKDIRKRKVVGWLNCWGDYYEEGFGLGYVEFYDKKLTRFEFANEQECREFIEQFYAVNSDFQIDVFEP